MRVEKKELAAFYKLYAQAVIWRDGKPVRYIAASEDNGPCVSIDAGTLESQTIWDSPGGTMTICQVNAAGDFLAVQRFLPVFSAAQAVVVHCKREHDSYRVLPCFDLPYIHRFEIVESGGVKFFVGGTLCGGKESQQDWSQPGRVYVGEIPEDLSQAIQLAPIMAPITKNHGFCKTIYNGSEVVMVSGTEGLFLLTPPQGAGGHWISRQLMNREISDMAVVDFDGDGVDEIAVIEGFHGNRMTVNKLEGGDWREIYSLDISLGHAIWGGKLLGRDRLLVGYRRDAKELLCLTPGRDGVEKVVLGNGGPSQLSVWEEEGRAVVYSADREAGEAVLYYLSED